MRNPLLTRTLAILLLSILAASPLSAQTKENGIVDTSRSVLNEIMAIPMKGIPRSMLADARGVAIIPNVLKVSFVAGGRHGRGVMMIRNDQGTWNAPLFVTLTGGSVGWQAGVQSTDIVLVFKTQKSVDGLLGGKFTIGVDAAAAAGPVGRRAEAATDAALKSELYSYSRSRGLFLGVSLDGSVLETDPAANSRYYGSVGAAPDAVMQGKPTTLPVSAVNLINQLATYTAAPPATTPPVAPAGPYAAAAGQPNVTPTPAQNDEALAKTAALRAQLDQNSRQLYGLLDERWRQYLALPVEVFNPGAPPPAAKSLEWSLGHFNTVTGNSDYSELAARPEFQRTHQLLRDYIESLKPRQQPGVLDLPPPPAD